MQQVTLSWRMFSLLLFASICLIIVYFPSPLTLPHKLSTLFSFSTTAPSPYKARVAVCLVGGARRFELTGPSIIDHVLNEYPNADLFLNSPLDQNSFKFSLLKAAPRVASFRVFHPNPIPPTKAEARVLSASGSPHGIQGLLQYFNLVEGCLTMIQAYQNENNFTYDWIVRTRVDSYWSAPLSPDNFIQGTYVVPRGSSFSGLNDRLGIGNYNTSIVALSRVSLIPTLDSLNYRGLNSESAFKAQLTSKKVKFRQMDQPFCILSDRKYHFPPGKFEIPVASLASKGTLSGAKCRPCKPACTGSCAKDVISRLKKGIIWTQNASTVELCDASKEWQQGWEEVFDRAAGENLAKYRTEINKLDEIQCVKEFEEIKSRATHWDTPPLEEMCKLGLDPKH